jgi:hypothetical protein
LTAKALDAAIGNLVTAVANSGGSPALLDALTSKEREPEAIRTRIREAENRPIEDPKRVSRALHTIAADWRGALLRNPPQARERLQLLFGGERLTVVPEDRQRVGVEGTCTIEPLIAQVACPS